MLTISFGAKGPDPMDDIIKDVKGDEKIIKAKIDSLASETEIRMKAIIADSKVRPQADEPKILETSITTDTFENGWGVGDVEWIKHAAPYWAALNWGSAHMVGKRVPNGQFEPVHAKPDQSYFRQDRWKKGKGRFSFIIGRPILAINYIERTVAWFENRINEILE